MNKRKPLIIFDCDGVLVDSEPISSRILAEELRLMGLDISNQQAISLFTGGKLADAFQYASDILKKPVPENLESIYRKKCVAAFEKELKAVTGIKEILNQLQNKKCVASNGPAHKVKANLNITGLTHFFGNDIFSAYDIQSWKPHPELFLFAAQSLGYAPKDCIVIEDSVTGIKAAMNAKMKVFGYTANGANKNTFEELGATVFNNMSILPELLHL